MKRCPSRPTTPSTAPMPASTPTACNAPPTTLLRVSAHRFCVILIGKGLQLQAQPRARESARCVMKGDYPPHIQAIQAWQVPGVPRGSHVGRISRGSGVENGGSAGLAAEQVALAPARQDQRHLEALVDLVAQVADVDIDHVGDTATAVVVKVLADH